MKVIRAQEMGMCFGVRDALKAAASITDPSQVTIHGELVHNSEVQSQLARRSFHQSAESDRGDLPMTPQVLITAHGISDVERARLLAANKQLVDTTCPLVRRAHDAVLQLQAEGRHIVVIGKPGHVEVQGLIEDLWSYDVVNSPEDVQTYDEPLLGIACQTTMPPDLADEVYAHIQMLNPIADIRMIDTICEPTKVRQRAMFDLVSRVEAVVVVGGRNSNNTKQLVRICLEHLTPVLHIERASELEPAWFSDVSTVGLTAGTSTLDHTIDEVERALVHIGTAEDTENTEDVQNGIQKRHGRGSGGNWYHGLQGDTGRRGLGGED